MNGTESNLNVLFEPVADCPCRKNCRRHGLCTECRIFHANHSSVKLPYCDRQRKPGLLKRIFAS